MDGWKFLKKFFQPNKSSATEPGTALFGRLRLNLTLWYTLILAGALLLFCIVLYFGVRTMLFASVHEDLKTFAHAQAAQGRFACISPRTLPPGPFPTPESPSVPDMRACYNILGQPVMIINSEQTPSLFTENSLVRTTLRTGQESSDIVDGGAEYGPIYRYAITMHDPIDGSVRGAIMVGVSIAAQQQALNILLGLLSTISIILLLIAIAGGLFLSHRALQPARLAFARQQRFIADASHELRTPLTFLCADTELLLAEREHLREEDAELLEDIFIASTRMTTLANNMLDLARLDAGKNAQHHEHEVLNLNDLAAHTVRLGKALAEKRNITLTLEHEQTTTVIGDPALLEQTLLILLDNAIKYNHIGGSVFLRVYTRGKQACLEICDTGIGIADEHLKHLGERFYRVDKARSQTAGGTGLGLAIAHGVATAHDGTLHLESKAGQGTKATLSLPLASVVVTQPS